MDYNKLTDFEINSAVHNYLMENPYKIYFLGEDKIRWVRGDTDVVTDKIPYKKGTLSDYCNNVSDAWKVIVENRIFIGPIFVSDWCATSECDSYRSINKNPLRAAMIVFIMMKESETISKRMLDNLNNTAKHEDFNTYE